VKGQKKIAWPMQNTQLDMACAGQINSQTQGR